ncbi:uncharacterized protein [Musca autumnalis]|uniref:uncharacterized protein n=1 Tax=Musca autumnalis TaxID=221902 RepID=UPI003CF2DBFE
MFYGKLLTVLAIVVVAKGQNNSTGQVRAYLAANKSQHDSVLKDYDSNLELFKQLYFGRLNTIDIQSEFLFAAIEETTRSLNNLEFLGQRNSECVSKYKLRLPNVADTRRTIQQCYENVNSTLTSYIGQPVSTRDRLEEYYNYSYENALRKCGNNNDCLINVVSKASDYTATNQKIDNWMI